MDAAVPPPKPIRIYEDYEYVVDNTSENVTYLACKFKRYNQCYGRGKLVGEEFQRTADHNHAPTENAETIAIFKRELRNACLTQFRNQKDIYEGLRALYPAAAMTVTYAAISSSMRRWRKLVHPRIPLDIPVRNEEGTEYIPPQAFGEIMGNGFSAPQPLAPTGNDGGNDAGAEEVDIHVIVTDDSEDEAMDVRNETGAEEVDNHSNPPPRTDDDERQIPLPDPIADVPPPDHRRSSVLVERAANVQRRRRRRKRKVARRVALVPVLSEIERGTEPAGSVSKRQARNKRRKVMRKRAKDRLKSENAALQAELAAARDEAQR